MKIFEGLAIYGSAIALENERGETCSYESLVQRGDAIGGIVEKKSLVLCLCDNSISSIIGYVGFMRSGHVPIMWADKIDVRKLNSLVEGYAIEYLWANRALEKELGLSPAMAQEGDYCLYFLGQEKSLAIHADLGLLMTTSGSTGSQKMVRLSHQNLLQNTISISRDLSISKEDRPITTLPMNYSYGLSIINTHLYSGARVLINTRSIIDRFFWDFSKRAFASTFGGVPYTYEMLFRLGNEIFKGTSLRYLTQAGGKLRVDILKVISQRSADAGIKFLTMYGQTEATARMSIMPSQYSEAKLGSIGLPILGGTFTLIAEDKKVISEPRTSGNLLYEGKNVCFGYAESYSDLMLGDINHGILDTGDIAYYDEDGFYYISGRRSRFIKAFGNRINLDEVENEIREWGQETACIGDEDVLVIYTAAIDGYEELKKRVSSFLNLHQSVIRIKYIERLPRNQYGKLQYSLLTEHSKRQVN